MLPNELWLCVLDQCSVQTIAKARTASRSFASLGARLLRIRIQPAVLVAAENAEVLQTSASEAQTAAGPLLAHYAAFMTEGAMTDLAEIAWFSAPPHELRAVCECLVRLRDHSLNLSPAPIPWLTTRKILSSYDFKLWFGAMATTVKYVPKTNALCVENIIRNDESITYVRLREVSMPGYRILIKIAAALQYLNIVYDLAIKQLECDSAQVAHLHLQNFSFALETDHWLTPNAIAYFLNAIDLCSTPAANFCRACTLSNHCGTRINAFIAPKDIIHKISSIQRTVALENKANSVGYQSDDNDISSDCETIGDEQEAKQFANESICYSNCEIIQEHKNFDCEANGNDAASDCDTIGNDHEFASDYETTVTHSSSIQNVALSYGQQIAATVKNDIYLTNSSSSMNVRNNSTGTGNRVISRKVIHNQRQRMSNQTSSSKPHVYPFKV